MVQPLPAFARITRDVVRVEGPDAVTFLHGQLSQDIAGLAVGGVAWSFLLQPQGKVDAWLRVTRLADDAVQLDVDRGWGRPVVDRLDRFKLRTRCELALVEAVPVVAVRGAESAGGLPCGWPDLLGVDVLGGASRPDDLPADAVELDDEAYQALRMAVGVPAMGRELGPDTIPAEVGQWVIDASVSFTKGCYTGQELVARIDSRGGNVPRRLRGFTTAAQPPAPGTVLVVDGQPVGTVTGAAIGSDGRTVGLAYVKRSAEPPFPATLSPADGDDAAEAVGSGSAVEVHALPSPTLPVG